MAKTSRLCWYCGEDADSLDHFIPNKISFEALELLRLYYPGIEKPAPKERSNIIAACKTCNQHKSNRLVESWRREIEMRIGTKFRFYGETVLTGGL